MCDIKTGFNSQDPPSMLSTIPASSLSYKILAAFSHFFPCSGQHRCVITSILHQKMDKNGGWAWNDLFCILCKVFKTK